MALPESRGLWPPAPWLVRLWWCLKESGDGETLIALSIMVPDLWAAEEIDLW